MFTETVEGIDEGLSRLLDAARSGELPVARLKDLIAASRSWEAKVAALQTDAARLIAARERHGDGGASVLRDRAGKSKFQARRSLGAAEVLDEMPGLRSAVDAGEVPLANAERLADAARRTAPETVDSASDLLAMAKELPPDRFARQAGAWTQRHQIDHGHEEYLQKRRRRYLKTWKQQDGMVRLDGLLDPETGTRICSRLQDAAEELRRQDQQSARTGRGPNAGNGFDDAGTAVTDSPGDAGSAADTGSNDGEGPGAGEGRRSWDQLQADALDLLTSGAAGAKDRGGSGGRPKAEVIVVADIGALTGDDPPGAARSPAPGRCPRRCCSASPATPTTPASSSPTANRCTTGPGCAPPPKTNGGPSSPATAAASAAAPHPTAAKPTTSCPTPNPGAPTPTTWCSSAGAATTTSTTTTGKSPTTTANPPSNPPTP